jgi:hypothetical protein
MLGEDGDKPEVRKDTRTQNCGCGERSLATKTQRHEDAGSVSRQGPAIRGWGSGVGRNAARGGAIVSVAPPKAG